MWFCLLVLEVILWSLSFWIRYYLWGMKIKIVVFFMIGKMECSYGEKFGVEVKEKREVRVRNDII